jgi:hypothetical protein
MTKGTTQQAIALAKQRFAQHFPFDLDDATWQRLFDAHSSGDILEAVKKSGTTRDRRPEKVFESLIYWIEKLERQHNEKERPLWPPSDVRQL